VPTVDLFHFARSRATGRILDVSQVERGLACNCVCAECGGRVLARKGKKNRHGFAHYGGSLCANAGEGGLHRAAKQILAEAEEIVLPKAGKTSLGSILIASTSIPDAGGWPAGERRPDVVWRSSEGQEIHVEVTVRNAIGDDKLADIAHRGVATLEFDLRYLSPDVGIGYAQLREILLSDPGIRRWAFHPLASATRHQPPPPATGVAAEAEAPVATTPPAAPTIDSVPTQRARLAAMLVGQTRPRTLGQFRFPDTWAFLYEEPGEEDVCNLRWIPFSPRQSLSLLNAELTRVGEAEGLICYFLYRVTDRQLIGPGVRARLPGILKGLGGVEVIDIP
jgi:hypothetical protein